jgi:hypothetical protein
MVLVMAIAFLTALAAVIAFIAVVAGIQVSERRMGLPGQPRSGADALARRMLLGASIGQQSISSLRTARQATQRQSNCLAWQPPAAGRSASAARPRIGASA